MSAQFVLSCGEGLPVPMRLSLCRHTRHTRHAGAGVINFAGVCRAFWIWAADGGFGRLLGHVPYPPSGDGTVGVYAVGKGAAMNRVAQLVTG